MRLISNCTICQKPLILAHELTLGENKLSFYKCGHFRSAPAFMAEGAAVERWDFQSVNHEKQARPYQEEGIKFIHNSGFSCILGDQMRLGKTPQSLLALKNAPERFPCLILPRATNIWQWIAEYKTWVDSLPLGIFPILGSKSFIPKGFSSYIMSMDTLSREGMVQKLLAFGFRLVIVDEAHSFKNPSSKRSQALIQFLFEISKTEITYTFNFCCLNCKHEWEESVTKVETRDQTTIRHATYCPKCNAYNVHSAHKEKINKERKCGVVLLTGTAIKNQAEEYFVPLNIVAPDKFNSLTAFRRNWLIKDSKHQWSRVNPYRLDAFKKEIAPYVLRREWEDVYNDLPPINRITTPIKIEDEKLKAAYNAQLDVMEVHAARTDYKYFDNIGELAVLRKICGLAKIPYAVEYAQEFFDEAETMNGAGLKRKLAIGVHHHSVGDSLMNELSNYGTIKFSGLDSPEKKYQIMTQFETSPERVLVVGMLAGGLGADFHYLDNVLILERQWSSADEAQFEARFYNPDKSIKNRSTNIEYVVASGTVDEFFYNLVENKRKIFGETIGTSWNLQGDSDSFRDLMQRTIAGRL